MAPLDKAGAQAASLTLINPIVDLAFGANRPILALCTLLDAVPTAQALTGGGIVPINALRALILFQAELTVQHGNTAQRTFALVVDVELVHATRASVLVSALRTVGDGVTAELALAGADEVVVLAGRTGRTGGAVEAVLQEAGTFQAFGVVEEVGALLA